VVALLTRSLGQRASAKEVIRSPSRSGRNRQVVSTEIKLAQTRLAVNEVQLSAAFKRQ